MSAASKEWQKFLNLYLDKGDRAAALEFAKSMKDADNKKSALHYLAPTASQKREAASRKKAATNTKTEKRVKRLVDQMASHSGFMSNSVF